MLTIALDGLSVANLILWFNQRTTQIRTFDIREVELHVRANVRANMTYTIRSPQVCIYPVDQHSSPVSIQSHPFIQSQSSIMRESYDMKDLIARLNAERAAKEAAEQAAEQEIIRHNLEAHNEIAQWVETVRRASTDAASQEMRPDGHQPAAPPNFSADATPMAIRPNLDNSARARQEGDVYQLPAIRADSQEMLRGGQELVPHALFNDPASQQQAGAAQYPLIEAGCLEMQPDGQAALRYDLAMRNRLGSGPVDAQGLSGMAVDQEMRPIIHHTTAPNLSTSLLNTPVNLQWPPQRHPTLPSLWDVHFEMTMDAVRGTEQNGLDMARLPCIDGLDRWGPNAWN
ncbi:hypothetical protein BDY17DRAFT_332946 [Neohortaea acidophila]|uniref:Uncharacterized protein n=1 Tax=Neohortaea acidophila TaxID=245834 RepID=A0A6A6Q0T9_9PEZI|nr:uncharacterized protein BDY17DRAFT_332946 [Neohortaea acidophila]KAF2485606.1 hypothetical protein BDY17DRAFT_332946 [Neohortaea acidophila]